MCWCNPLHPINVKKKTCSEKIEHKKNIVSKWCNLGRVCSLVLWVPAVLRKTFSDGLLLRFWTRWWSGGEGRGVGNSTPVEHTGTLARPPPIGGGGGRPHGLPPLLLFCFLCFFDRVILDVPSIQLDGAAVLLGFFSPVVLLARAHQAVQQVSCKDTADTSGLARYSCTGVE